MPLRILIVEDHPGNQEYLELVLRDLGITTRVAATADEAIRLARAEPPDLILMDVRLREGDGRAAARELKAHRDTAAIPIVAVTALAGDSDRQECLAAGCDAYLSKPFTPRQLRTKIRALVRHRLVS